MSMNAEAQLCPPRMPPRLPIAHSTQHNGTPNSKNAQKYAIINAPPPYCAASPGNLKKFPNPTALPATASIVPSWVFHVTDATDCFGVLMRIHSNHFSTHLQALFMDDGGKAGEAAWCKYKPF